MADLSVRLEESLRRLASGPAPGEPFAIDLIQSAGEPAAWEEWIRFERGRMQSYGRVRSNADEGGAAIGTWTGEAEESRVQAIAQALCEGQFWALKSDEEIEPGTSLVSWSCVTARGIFQLSANEASPVVSELISLDLELRRLANALEQSQHGAALVCQVDLETQGDAPAARVSLVNIGNRSGLVGNPLAAELDDREFFRVETAAAVVELPGVTDFGAEFKPLPLLPNPDVPAPWRDPYILLEPGQRLELPVRAQLAVPEPGPYILRAVYSHYGLVEQIGGIPVMRGRAFSNELELQL